MRHLNSSRMDLCTGGLAWLMLKEIGKGRKGWCRRMEIIKEVERSRSVEPRSWINTGDDSLISCAFRKGIVKLTKMFLSQLS